MYYATTTTIQGPAQKFIFRQPMLINSFVFVTALQNLHAISLQSHESTESFEDDLNITLGN